VTPRQASDGVLELGLPNGGSVLVSIEEDVPGRPDVDAQVIEAMLAANDEEEDVCRIVSNAIAHLGLRAIVSRDRHPTTVVVAVSEEGARGN
jgi:hypothetical protein